MTHLRRANPADLSAVSALLALYFEEWNLEQRDTENAILAALSAPALGYLLAEQNGTANGCVLGRPLPHIPEAAEMKRLFVHPRARGTGLGRLLALELEQQAAAAGFRWLYLDSKAEFASAISLYQSLGYTTVPRYNDNPEATLFFRKRLG